MTTALVERPTTNTLEAALDSTRRDFIRQMGGVALGATFLAACGDEDDAGRDAGDGDWTPVTVEHVHGSTTIERRPQRVVVAGLHEPEFLYALGVAPVGVHEWYDSGWEYTTGPWAEARRLELGAEPAVQKEWEIDVEWVAAQQPDLIIATYHELDDDMYERLSQVAPVVAHPSGYDQWTAPWQVELRLLGDALARRDRAEEVIADLERQTAALAAAHPEFKGARINTINYDPQAGGFETYSSKESLNTVLQTLGFVVPASFDALADGIYASFSMERMQLLDEMDVALWFSENREDLEGQAVYKTTRLSREGRSIWLEDPLLTALGFNTPLSIAYYLETLAPMLKAALDGNPATNAGA